MVSPPNTAHGSPSVQSAPLPFGPGQHYGDRIGHRIIPIYVGRQVRAIAKPYTLRLRQSFQPLLELEGDEDLRNVDFWSIQAVVSVVQYYLPLISSHLANTTVHV